MSQKKLCDWSKKRFEEKTDKLRSVVRAADHVCLKCGRSANNKKILCKPVKIGA